MIYPNQLIREFDAAAFAKRLQERLEDHGCTISKTEDGFAATKGAATHVYSKFGEIKAKICSFGAPSAQPA